MEVSVRYHISHCFGNDVIMTSFVIVRLQDLLIL